MLNKFIYNLSFCLLFTLNFLMANEQCCHESRPLRSPEFMTGYLKSKLEYVFPYVDVELAVQNNEIVIYRYPNDRVLCENIAHFLETQQRDLRVRFANPYEHVQPVQEQQIAVHQPVEEEGNWLPELTPFFPTMLANPRLISYSAGYRSYDGIFKTALLPVSMGDRFSLYQFKNIGQGRLYLGIEAGVWAVFEAKPKSLALINADYYIGIPLTYINHNFSARLRVYHQSSHLGDEIMLERKDIRRLNPSMEVVDLFASYDFSQDFTAFGGLGRVLRSDDSYKIKPYYVVYGFNYQINPFKIRVGNLDATPYVGVYFSNWQDSHWNLNSSIALGYQWDKLYGHKMRVSLEYHDGHSLEGQFSKKLTRYVALRLIYGY